MGEIADMIISGMLDEQTGEYLGEAVGYPRTKVKGNQNKVKNCAKKHHKGESLGRNCRKS